MATDTQSGRWTAIVLVAAGLVLAALVVFTSNNDVIPVPGSTNGVPTTAQPVLPAPTPKSAP